MNPIIQALASGYGINKILQYLSQSSPALAGKVSTALAYGYPASEVLKYVMKGGKSLDRNLPNASAADVNLYDKMGELPEEVMDAAKFGLGLAGTGLALGIGSRLGQAAQAPASAAGPAPNAPAPPSPGLNPLGSPPIPPPQGGTIGNINPGPGIGQQIANQAQAPVNQAMQPASPAQMGQAAQAMPQAAPQQSPIFEQLLSGVDPNSLSQPQQEQLKFLSMISDQLQAKGKGPNDPEFKTLAKKIKSVLQGKPGTVIEESARFQNAPKPIEEVKETTSIIEPSKIAKPQDIQKGESVVTEEGNIAQVKGVSGNNFLIEENGKVRQVPMDQLRGQPEAVKKAKIVFDPNKVPEEDRSAALAISIPMPDKSAILNMFHDGSFYIYKRKDGKPLDESIIKRVIEGQDIPLTTGETFMGAWNQDKGDSRGSAAYKELTSMAQSLEDMAKQDDPGKPLTFEKITNSFTHGYLKEFMKSLKEASRQFSGKPKKDKSPKK